MNDIIIIGCGPVGLYGAILSSLHNLKGIVIESLNQIGGQLTSLYPEKDIIDLPGFDKIKAKDFISKLESQYNSKENKLPIHLNESVLDIIKEEDYYLVKTTLDTYETKTILLTTGMGMFSPRLIGLENEKEIKNIFYSCSDVSIYKDKAFTAYVTDEFNLCYNTNFTTAKIKSDNNIIATDIWQIDDVIGSRYSIPETLNINLTSLGRFLVNRVYQEINDIISKVEQKV